VAADGGTAKKRRPRKPTQARASVFGAQSTLFDLFRQRADLAAAMKTHLENMREEITKLSPDIQEFSAGLIASMAQCGMEALQNLELAKEGNVNFKT
jgi:ribosomal protein L25 (general stress protein Ctc)